MQTSLTLNHLDLRAAALALAEASRTRTRDEKRDATVSRRLADTLHEAYPVALSRGEVTVTLSDEALFLLGTSLNRAAKGARWYGSRATLPVTPFRALARRLEA